MAKWIPGYTWRGGPGFCEDCDDIRDVGGYYHTMMGWAGKCSVCDSDNVQMLGKPMLGALERIAVLEEAMEGRA